MTKDLCYSVFCVFVKCSSLREVSGAMLGLSRKTKHFQLENLLYRSILSGASRRRDPDAFCWIHLFNNIHLMRLLEDTEKDWMEIQLKVEQYTLF